MLPQKRNLPNNNNKNPNGEPNGEPNVELGQGGLTPAEQEAYYAHVELTKQQRERSIQEEQARQRERSRQEEQARQEDLERQHVINMSGIEQNMSGNGNPLNMSGNPYYYNSNNNSGPLSFGDLEQSTSNKGHTTWESDPDPASNLSSGLGYWGQGQPHQDYQGFHQGSTNGSLSNSSFNSYNSSEPPNPPLPPHELAMATAGLSPIEEESENNHSYGGKKKRKTKKVNRKQTRKQKKTKKIKRKVKKSMKKKQKKTKRKTRK